MPLLDPKTNPALFADLYSKLTKVNGTQFLAFRDLPTLLSKYVSGLKTLDYGCGAGRSTRHLKSLGLEAEGVDISAEMIRHAISYDSEGRYQAIDSARLQAEDSSYDLVFACWVLMMIPTKQELLNVIKEISRVLKKGGTFIAVVCNENTYNNAEWLSHSTQFEENKDLYSGKTVRLLIKDINVEIQDYFWTEKDYREIINMANLNLLEVHKPLGKEHEGYKWINEKEKAICSIYVARK